ncbi:hypothetical protein [Streptomyces sp. NPDC051569]|uniref:hypothetical protein n=1 Tax=Streptomyces sp. NPDC051569 TaxID=3365661 RepID=UPI00378C7469
MSTAETLCGSPVILTGITDRRGSAVWKAVGPRGSVAVKSGYGVGAESVLRETTVLNELSGRTVVGGRTGDSVWYVTDWLDGPSTWKVFQPVRDGVDGRTWALTGAVELCRAAAELHELGWRQSDLQPSHGIHRAAGVCLIDFAWSWREGLSAPAHFRGGVTHLDAPEFAARIDDGARHVTPTVAADVYALAGALWTCATVRGRWTTGRPGSPYVVPVWPNCGRRLPQVVSH